MAIEQPAPIEFGEVQGTFGDVLEAATPDRQSVLRVRRSDIRSAGEKLLAQQAATEIMINEGAKLAVYEKRSQPGLGHSGAALLIDLGAANCLALTGQSAHQLACVLLAYSALENRRCDWLVRMESCQQDSILATYQALQEARIESR